MTAVAPERPVTPMDVEKRLRDLGVAVDEAHKELTEAERGYFTAKADLEIAYARAFLAASGAMDLRRYQATVDTADERNALAVAEALVRAARGNAERLRTQVDLARSVGTTLRASLEM